MIRVRQHIPDNVRLQDTRYKAHRRTHAADGALRYRNKICPHSNERWHLGSTSSLHCIEYPLHRLQLYYQSHQQRLSILHCFFLLSRLVALQLFTFWISFHEISFLFVSKANDSVSSLYCLILLFYCYIYFGHIYNLSDDLIDDGLTVALSKYVL